jgi:hypothetical protein
MSPRTPCENSPRAQRTNHTEDGERRIRRKHLWAKPCAALHRDRVANYSPNILCCYCGGKKPYNPMAPDHDLAHGAVSIYHFGREYQSLGMRLNGCWYQALSPGKRTHVPINGIIGTWPKSSRGKIPHSDNPTSRDLAPGHIPTLLPSTPKSTSVLVGYCGQAVQGDSHSWRDLIGGNCGGFNSSEHPVFRNSPARDTRRVLLGGCLLRRIYLLRERHLLHASRETELPADGCSAGLGAYRMGFCRKCRRSIGRKEI